MPKIVTPLTLGQVKSAKPADKLYKLPDGGGLALWVLPSGKKTWRLSYTRPSDGRQDSMTLGAWPQFTLTEAREWLLSALLNLYPFLQKCALPLGSGGSQKILDFFRQPFFGF